LSYVLTQAASSTIVCEIRECLADLCMALQYKLWSELVHVLKV